MARRRKWAQLDLLALDPARLAASFDGELERESRARQEDLLLTISQRDTEEGLKARKRLYRRAVLDRRLLLWIVFQQRDLIAKLQEESRAETDTRTAALPCS